jgi:hypothetical protein
MQKRLVIIIALHVGLIGYAEQLAADSNLNDSLDIYSWCALDYKSTDSCLLPDINGNISQANLRLAPVMLEFQNIQSYTCEIESTSTDDRSVCLRLVFPLDCAGWIWHDDAVSTRIISGNTIFSNILERLNNTTANFSKYPIAVIENPKLNQAIVLAVPPRPARPVRFVYDNNVRQLRAEFDFGLSIDSDKYPKKADASVIAFVIPSGWGFRRALERYYEIYDSMLHKRAGQGGTLITKSNPAGISNPQDFHFAWHDFTDTYFPWANSDQALGIKSFLYKEPQSGWRNLRKNLSSTAHITFDDGTPGSLIPSGIVTFSNGTASLSPGSSLTIPGLPTTVPEQIVAEFTILNYDQFAARNTYEVGFYHRFLCGIRKAPGTGNIPKLGCFDYAASGWQTSETIGNVSKVTIRMVADIADVDNRTYVQAGYDANSRNGANAPMLHLAGTFPWGTWSSESGTELKITNWVDRPVIIDNVIIKRYSGDIPLREYQSYVTQLNEDANDGAGKAQANLTSMIKTASGDYDLYLGNIAWTTCAPFAINPNPNISKNQVLDKAGYEFYTNQRVLG